VPRANCTHITMDVLHCSDVPCDFCGRVSVLGWLYQCQQDISSTSQARQQLHSMTDKLTAEKMSPVEELEAMGMSESIIEQYKKGGYEPWQIELLKAQKLQLQKAIEKQLDKEREPWNTHNTPDSVSARSERRNFDHDVSGHPNITMRMSARHATLSLVQKMSKLRHRSASMGRCTLKCCQSCRPYFKDRTFMSFDSVFADEIDPLETIEGLPIANVAIVRQLGLRQPSGVRTVFSGGSSSEATSSSGFSSPSSSGSNGSDLEFDVDQIENPVSPIAEQVVPGVSQLGSIVSVPRAPPTPYMMHTQTPPPGSFVTDTSYSSRLTLEQLHNTAPSHSDPGLHASPQTSTTGISTVIETPAEADTEDDDFDLGLQRLTPRSKGSINLVAAAGLRKEVGMGEWLGSARRGSASSSTYSDEVAVDGGVALTEEAVEMQTPDIITQA
jgi:hypothetical protein